MTATPRQLVLDLELQAALAAEDFLVSASNRAAIELIDRWPAWPGSSLVVTGPEGCGKSHLLQVWRARAGADVVAATDLGETAIAAFEANPRLAVEDLDRGIASERILFHLLNLARERQGSLLLTSRLAPGELSIALPDLRSRLRALPVAAIEPPDEALLKAVLVKLFADRQLAVEPSLIAYIGVRMERSMRSAVALVAEVDRLALVLQRRVTKAVVSEALKTLGVPE